MGKRRKTDGAGGAAAAGHRLTRGGGAENAVPPTAELGHHHPVFLISAVAVADVEAGFVIGIVIPLHHPRQDGEKGVEQRVVHGEPLARVLKGAVEIAHERVTLVVEITEAPDNVENHLLVDGVGREVLEQGAREGGIVVGFDLHIDVARPFVQDLHLLRGQDAFQTGAQPHDVGAETLPAHILGQFHRVGDQHAGEEILAPVVQRRIRHLALFAHRPQGGTDDLEIAVDLFQRAADPCGPLAVGGGMLHRVHEDLAGDIPVRAIEGRELGLGAGVRRCGFRPSPAGGAGQRGRVFAP